MYEPCEEGGQDRAQKRLQPFEDEAEVVADGGQHGVGVVAVLPLEVVAAEMACGLHVSDHRLDGRAAPELALDLAVYTTLLAGEVDPERSGRVVAAVALVGVDPLDLAAGERLGFLDHLGQGMAVVRVARQGFGVEHEPAALCPPVGGGDRHLHAELVGLVGLALADALGLRGVPGVELAAAPVLALVADPHGLAEGNGEGLLKPIVAVDLAVDVANEAAQARAQELELAVGALELLGVRVAPRHQRRPLGDPDVGLPQRHLVGSRLPAQLLDRLQHQLGVGGVRDVLRLHRGVHGDALEIVRLQRAELMRHSQALSQQRIELVADPLASVAHPRALMRKGVLEERLAGEVLEVGIVEPALAYPFVGHLVDVFQEQEPDHEPRLGRRPAVLAEQPSQLGVEPVPVDLIGQPRQLVAHVDDLIEPGPEQIARAFLRRLLRSHRQPPQCDQRITDRRDGESSTG